MVEAVGHRGPDSSGHWTSHCGHALLGHTRLSIVDLSSAGHQPMGSRDGRWVLSYNGEIYNADELRTQLGRTSSGFRGHSDTEVLVEAVARWGIHTTLSRAVGMFAFAAWNNDDQELWLATDRFGEKPMYFGRLGDRWLFGSELSCIRAAEPGLLALDRDALALFLRYGHVPAPHTIHAGVSKLMPGSVVRLRPDSHEAHVVDWWSPIETAAGVDPDPVRGAGSVDELESVLGAAVDSRMVADVPIGSFLSGGIDSSLIVALMRRDDRRVNTFTMGFQELDHDESKSAAAVAAHLGTDHTTMMVTHADALSVIPELAHVYDEPFADSSQIPTALLCRLTRAHVKVALSGDGGDELFGGYSRYGYFERLERFASAPSFLRRSLARGLRSVPRQMWNRFDSSRAGPTRRIRGVKNPARRAHQLAEILEVTDWRERYDLLLAAEPKPSDLLVGDIGGLDAQRTRRVDGQIPDHWSARQLAMAADTIAYLPNDILTKVDRASMAFGLEVRTPLLDPTVFDFAWRLHTDDRVDASGGKLVMRRLLQRFVPPELVDRPKSGFSVPLDAWLRGPLVEWAADMLAPSRLVAQGVFDSSAVARLWDEHQTYSADHSARLWPILIFQSWCDEWM